MPRVMWTSIATNNPMGQQHYEVEIQRALRAVAGTEWRFDQVTLSSLRRRVGTARRSPAKLVFSAPLPVTRAVGAAVYRTRSLVHRLDLRLPPAWGDEVATVHDLPPLRFDDEGTVPRSMLAGVRRSRVVITPSVFAAEELRDLAGVTRTVVIPYGVSDDYAHGEPATTARREQLGVPSRFVIHAAGASKRKNLTALAAAWRAVHAGHPDVTLLLCGPPDARRDSTFDGIAGVLTPGRLPASEIAALMRVADAVVVPSTYEGFGLPALEGMVCGAPVVAARAGALPEVVGAGGLLVDPDPDGIAGGLDTVLSDGSAADGLRAAGPARARDFSWAKAAQAHLDVYRSVL